MEEVGAQAREFGGHPECFGGVLIGNGSRFSRARGFQEKGKLGENRFQNIGGRGEAVSGRIGQLFPPNAKNFGGVFHWKVLEEGGTRGSGRPPSRRLFFRSREKVFTRFRRCFSDYPRWHVGKIPEGILVNNRAGNRSPDQVFPERALGGYLEGGRLGTCQISADLQRRETRSSRS